MPARPAISKPACSRRSSRFGPRRETSSPAIAPASRKPPTETARSWCGPAAAGCRPRSRRAAPPATRFAHERRAHRHRGGRDREEHDADDAIRRQAPNERRGDHRDAHHVEDVDLQEVDERRPSRAAATAAGTGRRARRSAAPRLRAMRRRGGVPDLRGARRGGHRDRQAGEKQEQRRRQAGDEHRVPCRGAAAIVDARPRVGDVRADHEMTATPRSQSR